MAEAESHEDKKLRETAISLLRPWAQDSRVEAMAWRRLEEDGLAKEEAFKLLNGIDLRPSNRSAINLLYRVRF